MRNYDIDNQAADKLNSGLPLHAASTSKAKSRFLQILPKPFGTRPHSSTCYTEFGETFKSLDPLTSSNIQSSETMVISELHRRIGTRASKIPLKKARVDGEFHLESYDDVFESRSAVHGRAPVQKDNHLTSTQCSRSRKALDGNATNKRRASLQCGGSFRGIEALADYLTVTLAPECLRNPNTFGPRSAGGVTEARKGWIFDLDCSSRHERHSNCTSVMFPESSLSIVIPEYQTIYKPRAEHLALLWAAKSEFFFFSRVTKLSLLRDNRLSETALITSLLNPGPGSFSNLVTPVSTVNYRETRGHVSANEARNGGADYRFSNNPNQRAGDITLASSCCLNDGVSPVKVSRLLPLETVIRALEGYLLSKLNQASEFTAAVKSKTIINQVRNCCIAVVRGAAAQWELVNQFANNPVETTRLMSSSGIGAMKCKIFVKETCFDENHVIKLTYGASNANSVSSLSSFLKLSCDNRAYCKNADDSLTFPLEYEGLPGKVTMLTKFLSSLNDNQVNGAWTEQTQLFATRGVASCNLHYDEHIVVMYVIAGRRVFTTYDRAASELLRLAPGTVINASDALPHRRCMGISGSVSSRISITPLTIVLNAGDMIAMDFNRWHLVSSIPDKETNLGLAISYAFTPQGSCLNEMRDSTNAACTKVRETTLGIIKSTLGFEPGRKIDLNLKTWDLDKPFAYTGDRDRWNLDLGIVDAFLGPEEMHKMIYLWASESDRQKSVENLI